MADTFLNVPFAQKDEAKALGARWDANNKLWFVPNGFDTTPFNRWMKPTIPFRKSVVSELSMPPEFEEVCPHSDEDIAQLNVESVDPLDDLEKM
ncbi:MAG: DUF5710 domain-containing protein [Gallionella sp.]